MARGALYASAISLSGGTRFMMLDDWLALQQRAGQTERRGKEHI